MIQDGFTGDIVNSSGDTYLLSVCLMDTGGAHQRCGEYWILIPSLDQETVLDKKHPQHQVLLLVDKQEYDTNNELVVYVPTSHVLLHDADMLGLQLLTYHGEVKRGINDELNSYSHRMMPTYWRMTTDLLMNGIMSRGSQM